MQGVKCIMGMSERCHSVWYKCRARAELGGEGGRAPSNEYGEPGSQFDSYDEMLEFLRAHRLRVQGRGFHARMCASLKGAFLRGEIHTVRVP
eukprot:3435554-Prymnesium_polylepis.1